MSVQKENKTPLEKKLEKYGELAKEYLKKTLQSQSTTILAFRVPVSTKTLYLVLPPEIKKAIRQTVIKMVEQAYEQVVENEETNVIINVNIPVSIATAKAEAKTEVKIDVTPLVAAVNELKEIITQWYQARVIPTAGYKRVMKPIQTIEEMIMRMN